jgi:hypothetical protein
LQLNGDLETVALQSVGSEAPQLPPSDAFSCYGG